MANEPTETLTALKAGKSQRTQKSLDKLNEVLKVYCDSGGKNFSIANIGRLSVAARGIGTVSIRNASGVHYRQLIEAWSAYANASKKKPAVKDRVVPNDQQLLDRLNDPALKKLFGQIIAERNQLKAENRLLKQNPNLVVDLRPNVMTPTVSTSELLPTEREALSAAISPELMARLGWVADEETGKVSDTHGQLLYQAGYLTGIKKLI